MLWNLVIVGVTGVLLGLRFRASALVAATGVTFAVSAVAGGFDKLVEWRHMLSILLLVVALQGAYLVGLLLAIIWHRAATHTP